MSYRSLSKYRTELMGFAMLWVMGFHAFDLDLGSEALNHLRSDGFGGVDIFILLSAMGLAMSQLREETEYGGFLLRRARRLLPAYYAVMLPYTAYLIRSDGVPSTALLWNGTLLYYWVQNEGAFNWYVAGAMLFYVLTPPFFRLLKRCRHRTAAAGALVAGGFLVSQWLLQTGECLYMDFFYRVPVFFLGLLIGFYAADDRRVSVGAALFWAASLAVGFRYGSLVRAGADTSPVILQFCHVFLFTTVPMCLVLCLLFERMPLGALRAFLRLIGRCSLEIYLLNVSFFSRVLTIRRYLHFGPTNRLYYLIIFILNIALGCLLHRAIEAVRARLGAKQKEQPIHEV